MKPCRESVTIRCPDLQITVSNGRWQVRDQIGSAIRSLAVALPVMALMAIRRNDDASELRSLWTGLLVFLPRDVGNGG